MAVFSGPKIVNDGIVLHLDAVNTRSFPTTSFTWRDLSRRGNNAVLRNAPSVLTFKDLPARARALRAFAFNGTDQFTEIPRSDDFDFGSGDLTIEYWLYMESYNPEGNVPVNKTQSNGSAGLAVGHYITSSGLLGMYASDNTSYTVSATGGTVTLNEWHHICLTRIGSAWTTYLNTEVVSTATWSGSVSHDTSGDYGGIGIGAYTNAYGGDAGRYSTDGRFSGVKIYKGKGLTSEEVQQNYHAKVARHVTVPAVAAATDTVELPEASTPSIITDGLVLHLDAGDASSYSGSGTTWTDVSGNSNNGTLVNGITFSSENGGYFVFDGASDYVSFSGTYEQPQYLTTTSFTWNVWFKPYFNDNNVIMGNRYGNGFGFHKLTTNNWEYYSNNFGGTIPLNNWINVTLVKDSTQFYYYRNATLHATSTSSIEKTAQPFYLGGDASGERARIDLSVASVYNKALTEQEIQQNFEIIRGRYGI